MNIRALALSLLLALSMVPSADSSSVSVRVTMDAETYSAASTLAGVAPVARIDITDSAGAGLAGVEVRVVFLRVIPLFGYASNETVIVETDQDGVATAEAPQLSGLPGNYFVVAFVGSTTGSDRYTVGA